MWYNPIQHLLGHVLRYSFTNMARDVPLHVDLLPVNRFTIRQQFSMLNILQELDKLAGSKIDCTFDLNNGYRQLPFYNALQTSQAFQENIPAGVISYNTWWHVLQTRFVQRSTNAFMQLQSPMACNIPSHFLHEILYWLRHFLLHAKKNHLLHHDIQHLFLFCIQ